MEEGLEEEAGTLSIVPTNHSKERCEKSLTTAIANENQEYGPITWEDYRQKKDLGNAMTNMLDKVMLAELEELESIEINNDELSEIRIASTGVELQKMEAKVDGNSMFTSLLDPVGLTGEDSCVGSLNYLCSSNSNNPGSTLADSIEFNSDISAITEVTAKTNLMSMLDELPSTSTINNTPVAETSSVKELHSSENNLTYQQGQQPEVDNFNFPLPSILHAIGQTRSKLLKVIPGYFGLADIANFLVKYESSNPTGTVKDRVAKTMFHNGAKEGEILPRTSRSTVIIPYSINLGISMALHGMHEDFRVVAFIPSGSDAEEYGVTDHKLKIFTCFNGQPIRLPAAAVRRRSAKLAASLPYTKLFHEFPYMDDTELQQEQSKKTMIQTWTPLLRELINDCEGPVDVIVCTRDSIGLAYASKSNKGIDGNGKQPFIVGVHLVEDSVAEVSSQPNNCPPFPPDLNFMYLHADITYKIGKSDAYKMCLLLLRDDVVLAAPTSGAVVCAGLKVCQDLFQNKLTSVSADTNQERKKNIVLMFDENLQFYNTSFLNPTWLHQNKILTDNEMVWWWKLRVSKLQMITPSNEVDASITVENAIQIFERSDKSKSPSDLMIVNEMIADGSSLESKPSSKILGIVSKPHLEFLLETNKIKCSDQLLHCPNAISDSWFEITLDTTMGELMQIFRKKYYCLITIKQCRCDGRRKPADSTTNEEGKLLIEHYKIILGILTIDELRKYTTKIEDHHKLEQNLDLNHYLNVKFNCLKV